MAERSLACRNPPDPILRYGRTLCGRAEALKREEFYREEKQNLDSLTDLKERGIVRPEFIDELTSRHIEVHAACYGTMVWILMMLEQWFGQHGAAARAGHPSALGHSSSVQAN